MNGKQLFIAIGNIDDKFIVEDAEDVISSPKHEKKRSAVFAPWVKIAAPLAACLVIAVAVFSIPNLFKNTDDPSGTKPENPSTSEPNGQQTEPGDETLPGNEPPKMLVLYDGFGELRELYALLEQNDESLEAYLNGDDRYYMNGLQTRAGVENLFSWLSKQDFPFMDGAAATDTVIRTGGGPITVRYEINGVAYVFTLNANDNWDPDEIIANWNVEIDGPLEMVKSENGISIYLVTPNEPLDNKTVFIINLRGVYTVANVFNAGDSLSAVDGIRAFEFHPLIME